MKILNVRLGLATNSSSTHNLIFLSGAKDKLVNGESAFGWENFVCASPQAKKDYLAAAIFENLKRTAGDAVALTVARDVARLWRFGLSLHVFARSITPSRSRCPRPLGE